MTWRRRRNHAKKYAGRPAYPLPSMLMNLPRLVTVYYTEEPDPTLPAQRVASGASGHRGVACQEGGRYL
jgi:hypothetical protein